MKYILLIASEDVSHWQLPIGGAVLTGVRNRNTWHLIIRVTSSRESFQCHKRFRTSVYIQNISLYTVIYRQIGIWFYTINTIHHDSPGSFREELWWTDELVFKFSTEVLFPEIAVDRKWYFPQNRLEHVMVRGDAFWCYFIRWRTPKDWKRCLLKYFKERFLGIYALIPKSCLSILKHCSVTDLLNSKWWEEIRIAETSWFLTYK